MDLTPDSVAQVPAVFSGPTADAAFFVALVVAVFGLYNIAKLLKGRASVTVVDTQSDD